MKKLVDSVKKEKKGKGRKEWDKIIVNVPKELLNEFDRARETQYYSRSEAIKESMRYFILEMMGEDYIPPKARGQVVDTAADMMEGFAKGGARAAADPEIQKMVQQQAIVQQEQALAQQKQQYELQQAQQVMLNKKDGGVKERRERLPSSLRRKRKM